MKIGHLQSRVERMDNARWHGGLREDFNIHGIITHCTYGDSFMSSIEYMNRDLDDPNGPQKKVSYNYGVERDGKIIRMTPYIAYHAGDSAWPNPTQMPPGNGGHSVNAHYLGIAFALEQGEKPTEIQLESALWLHRTWMDRAHIPPSYVRGHWEVSPGRKTDPGGSVDMSLFRIQLAGVELIP